MHLPYLNNPFLFDDSNSIYQNQACKSLGNIPRFFTDTSLFATKENKDIYRPILLTSYAVNYAISGDKSWSWRIFNLLIMAANACFLIPILGNLGIKRPFNVIGGMLFLVHPMTGFCFRHVSTRSTLLMSFFILLGIFLHEKSFSSASGRINIRIAAPLFCMMLSLLSSDAGVIFPAMILLWDGPIILSDAKRSISRIMPYAAFAAIYLSARTLFMGRPLGGGFVRPVGINAALQLKAWWVYLKYAAYPIRMPIYADIATPGSYFEMGVIAAAIGVAIWAAIGLKFLLSKNHSTFGILLLWPLVCYLPFAAIPLNVPVAYHHFYLSFAGIAGIIAAALSKIENSFESSDIRDKQKRYRLRSCLGGAAICLISLNILADKPWQSYIEWAQQTARENPSSGRAWNEIGMSYIDAVRYDDAIEMLKKAGRIDPSLPGLNLNLGIVYYYAEKYYLAAKSLEYFQNLPAVRERDWMVDGNIGISLLKTARPRSAIPFLDAGLKGAPDHTEYRIYKNQALETIAKADEAMATYDSLYPNSLDDVDTLRGRVELLLDLNDVDAALLYLEYAERKIGANSKLTVLRGKVFEKMGAYEEAVEIYRRAMDLTEIQDEKNAISQRMMKLEKKEK